MFRFADYQPDPHNANRGNPRGRKMIADSFRDLGAGRSVLAEAEMAITYRRFSVRQLEQDMAGIFLPAAQRIGGLLQAAKGSGTTLDRLRQERREALLIDTGDIVQALFTAPGTRWVFAEDGVSMLTPFARVLNEWYVRVTYAAVRPHHDWMRRHVPTDVQSWLYTYGRRIREQNNPFLRQPNEGIEAYQRRLRDLRLFEPNPLARYDTMHIWVDPKGYTLSQRIWRTGSETRLRLETMVSDLIAQGKGARERARAVEQFLIPGRAPLRTRRPYGSDASFDAMRLARTEIAAAANRAAYAAAVANPYVGDMTCHARRVVIHPVRSVRSTPRSRWPSDGCDRLMPWMSA